MTPDICWSNVSIHVLPCRTVHRDISRKSLKWNMQASILFIISSVHDTIAACGLAFNTKHLRPIISPWQMYTLGNSDFHLRLALIAASPWFALDKHWRNYSVYTHAIYQNSLACFVLLLPMMGSVSQRAIVTLGNRLYIYSPSLLYTECINFLKIINILKYSLCFQAQ